MIDIKNTDFSTALYSLAIAGLFCFLSFYGTDAETYLFPRIIAIALLGLSVVLFISTLKDKHSSEEKAADRDRDNRFFKILPGLAAGIIYLTVMDTIGFYTSSFLVFLAFLILYGERGMTDPKAFVKKLAVATGFVLVLYLLFWQGLHVRTPTGWLF